MKRGTRKGLHGVRVLHVNEFTGHSYKDWRATFSDWQIQQALKHVDRDRLFAVRANKAQGRFVCLVDADNARAATRACVAKVEEKYAGDWPKTRARIQKKRWPK